MFKKLVITLTVVGLIGLAVYGLYFLTEFALTLWALHHVIL